LSGLRSTEIRTTLTGVVSPAWYHWRGITGVVSPAWYHRRHKVENFFQRIKVLKRVATRYEKLALTFLNFILVAAVFDWLKSS
jgi:transposase